MKNENRKPKFNSEGIMQAVGIAMFHMGKLDNDQRHDLISAALDAIKITVVDDLTHNIGVGECSDAEIVERIGRLACSMEDVRRARVERFANLCEMLKPETNIQIEFASDLQNGDNAASQVMMPDNGSIN